uniref:ORF37 n=1 Tax=Nitrosopumilaceae spindle-shaped virus TaxID=3065433 RepID=A0AAT9J773_9VIRU
MKVVKNYSLNIEVVKAFDAEVSDQTRSRLIEALMIKFLVEYTRGNEETPSIDDSSLTTEKEAIQ